MKTIALLLAAAALAPLAHAHITLEQKTASAGAYHKLTFRVGHGCAGSATTGITVLLPEAVIGAKPMPKAGWSITTADAKLATPVLNHGVPVTSAVREVNWKGGPLPDAHYDEFAMQVRLPETPGKYHFKVTQFCQNGRADWSETAGMPGVPMKFPAPVLDVLPAAVQPHH